LTKIMKKTLYQASWRTTAYALIVPMLVGLAYGFSSVVKATEAPGHAVPSVWDGALSGTWLLVNVETGASTLMRLEDHIGTGLIAGPAHGRAWQGKGSFVDGRGRYSWRFENGASGRTELRYLYVQDAIVGCVKGSGLDWCFAGFRL